MDPVKQYRERFWTLWTVLKKFFTNENFCNNDSNQKLGIGDCVIQLHNLARTIEDPVESNHVRNLANELAKIGNRIQEKIQKFENPEKIT